MPVVPGSRANEPPPFRPRHVTDPWFAKVWRATGLPGKPPPVYVSRAWVPQAAGWQPYPNRAVYISPNVLMGLKQTRQGKRYDLGALNVLLHEMAHTAQPRVLRRGIAEGGADPWANANVNRVASRLYPPPFDYEPLDYRSPASRILPRPKIRPSYYGYPNFSAQIRQPTRDYGQFGLPVPPPPRRRWGKGQGKYRTKPG